MYIILKTKLKDYTKDIAIVLGIMIFWFVLIIAIMTIKYKPVYEVTIQGETVGYIINRENFENKINEEIISQEGNNIEYVSLDEQPKYELKLLARNQITQETQILEKLKNEYTTITYKYYIVALNDENKAYVDTLEEAEQIVNEIKSEYDGEELDLNLQILTQYTENFAKVKTDTIEVAENNVRSKVDEIKEKENALAIINGVNLSFLPVTGRITSRYGESSSLRSSTHTGLDIACSKGTDILATASGTVTFASYKGSYGNLVKIDHGNGIETWYGHCSKIYVSVGDQVPAGGVIAAVGSTGNSTGPHLHFEIRTNGNTVNPQNYLYSN